MKEIKSSIYEFIIEDINGKLINFKDFKNKLLLISNFASKCGLCNSNLKNFSELKNKNSDLEILLFPSNDFKQESKNYEEIKEKILKINKNFIIFKLTEVTGKNKTSLFEYLIKNSKGFLGNGIKWNFTKWLINKNGEIKKRISPFNNVNEKDIELIK